MLPSLSFASADDYPTRPVRIIAGFAAGGAVDIIARLIAHGCRSALASNASLRIVPAQAAISQRNMC